jgi:hypothetical protein
MVKECGGKVAVFNLERSNGDEEADYLFLGNCEVTLTDVLGVKDEVGMIRDRYSNINALSSNSYSGSPGTKISYEISIYFKTNERVRQFLDQSSVILIFGFKRSKSG